MLSLLKTSNPIQLITQLIPIHDQKSINWPNTYMCPIIFE